MPNTSPITVSLSFKNSDYLSLKQMIIGYSKTICLIVCPTIPESTRLSRFRHLFTFCGEVTWNEFKKLFSDKYAAISMSHLFFEAA